MTKDEALKMALETAWQPIETAPKCGVWIVVFDNKGEVHPDYWLGNDINQWAKEPFDATNTHWMPLPKPPTDVSPKPIASIKQALAQPEPVVCVACEGSPSSNNIPCAVCGATATAQPVHVQEPVNAWQIFGLDNKPLFIQQDEGSAKRYAEVGHRVERLARYTTLPPVQPAPVQEPAANAFMTHLYNFGYKSGHHDTVEGRYTDISSQDMDTYHSDVVSEWLEDTCITTPPAQREWVGLTDEEVDALWEQMKDAMCLDHKTWWQEIESKLKDKNT